MAARKRPPAVSLLDSVGPLGLIVSSFPPHARAFLRAAVGVTAAASIDHKDRDVMFRAIDKAFAEIEPAGQAGDRDLANEAETEKQAWLRRQLEGLDGGRA